MNISFKHLSFLIVCACLAFLFITLGFWQMQRLKWKTDLIRQSEQRAIEPPILLSALVNPDNKQQWNQRRVTVTGQFIEPNFYLENKVLNGTVGYYVLTPFQSGEAILFINRGWISKTQRDQVTTPKRTVTMTGTIHYPPTQKPRYAPDNDISPTQTKHLFWIDLKTLHAQCCAANALFYPFYLDLTETTPSAPDQPVPVNDYANLPNNHLQYAITWFSLTLITIVMSGIYIRRSKSMIT